jgi:predicted alpha/beta superfamily hydrolase
LIACSSEPRDLSEEADTSAIGDVDLRDPEADAPDAADGMDLSPDREPSADPMEPTEPDVNDGGFDAAQDNSPDTTEPVCSPIPEGFDGVEIQGTGRVRRIGAISAFELSARDVTIYLPDVYAAEVERRFPVLYMHDGQNLFEDEEASFGVAWQVDESVERLAAAGIIEPTIVVGIDNTNSRMTDYTPDVDPDYGGGGGDRYADFLALVLKPIIDNNLRTRCGRRDTAVAGSSLGALISLHVGLRHADAFGRIGAVSPSLWWNRGSTLDTWASYDGRLPRRLWLDMGTAEGGGGSTGIPGLVAGLRAFRGILQAQGMTVGDNLGYLEDPGMPHNESAWRNRLDSTLGFLLGDDVAPLTGLSVFVFDRHIDSGHSTNMAIESVDDGGLRLTWPNDRVDLTSLTPDFVTVAGDGTIRSTGTGLASIEAEIHDLVAVGRVWSGDVDTQTIRFEVTVPDSTPDSSPLYISGSIPELGEWSADGLLLRPLNRTWWADLEIVATSFEYKVTRGTWETVEVAASGDERANRSWSTDDSNVIRIRVEGWAD